ncbi:MAG: hypothetical protein QM696_01145 [Steroidobacteraceae bacterium]
MSKDAQRPRTAGFALAEVLVAALLLALALLGAARSLVESLGTQRAALLQTRAADLAADLAEALRPAPPAEESRQEIALWQAEVQRVLPEALARARRDADAWTIELQWRDPHPAGTMLLRLPVTSAAGSGP